MPNNKHLYREYHYATFFDITAANAVESILSGSKTPDPWGKQMLGVFADMLIYGDKAIFPLHVTSKDLEHFTAKKVFDPLIFTEMLTISSFESGDEFLVVRPYSEADVAHIDVSRMDEAFSFYCSFASRPERQNMIRLFSKFHHSPEMRLRHSKNIKTRLLHDVKAHISEAMLYALCEKTNMSPEEHLYCFDVVFRYCFYGSIAFLNANLTGTNAPYLSHPIRRAMQFGELHEGEWFRAPELKHKPPLISFASTFEKGIGKFSRSSFFDAVKILREEADRFKLRASETAEVQRETLREMAFRARLPGRLRPEAWGIIVEKLTRAAAMGAGWKVGELAGDSSYGPAIGAFLGSQIPVKIAKSAWEKRSPLLSRAATDTTWLRPFLRYDIESEINRQ